MAGDYSTGSVIEYLISNNEGQIKTGKNNKPLKKLIINNKEYYYNKDKPLSTTLQTKLNQVSNTQGFKRFHLLKKASNTMRGIKTIQKYRIRAGAKTSETFSALKRYANTYSITNIPFKGYKGFTYLKWQEKRLSEYLEKEKSMKIIIDVDVLFDHHETETPTKFTMRSRRYNILNIADLKKALDNMPKDIELQIENSELTRSGFIINKVHKINIHYDKYNPNRAGTYMELPEWISKKKACINIQNDDELCFKYCVLCKFYEVFKKDHPQHMRHYKKLITTESLIKWDGVNFPASNDDIDTFETINQNSISVNVYVEDVNQTIRADRITKIERPSCHINLLRIEKDDNDASPEDHKLCEHYVLIKYYNRLMGSQVNKYKGKTFCCRYCQHGFTTEKLLNSHLIKGCMANDIQQTKMPEEGTSMKFEKHFKKLKAPFVIYGDFECLTTETSEGIKGTYQNHKPSGYMLNLVNAYSGEMKPFLYRGEDCIDKFCDTLNNIRDDVMEQMKKPKDMIMSDLDEIKHLEAKKCFLCNGAFNNKVEAKKKVADHCHFTGLYRGAAHMKCNIDYCFKKYHIPVFFHNLKNYDAHLIISNLEKLNTKKESISVIAQNSEKFITFSLNRLEFKDSFSFLSSSLEKLVKLTKYEDNKLRDNWQEHFKYSFKGKYIKNEKDLFLLTEKGVYPYDYCNDFNKFNDTELPEKKHFYSRLSEEDISDADYERAKLIWKHFNIKNLGEYHDLYLETDVLLLTDVYENFRKQCLTDYELDPAHYYTLPNFAWDAMLLKTGIELELLHDEELYNMVEKGLRGGMVQCAYKKAIANNKYMGEDYDKSKPSSYISYLDANNLYGLAMCKKLPYKNIKFVKDNFTEEDIKYYNSDYSSKGYILDVDLEYPKECHDKHIDYPLAPEIMNITADMLSDVQKQIYKEYNNGNDPKDEKTNKLILNVMDKQNYVLHIDILKFYLKQGLKVKKINRVIEFRHKQWLKPWIDFNTEKRKEATSDFSKDMYKLMNNAVYGKSMQNVRNQIDFELVDTPERYQKCVNNPNFKYRHIINENLIGVEKAKSVVKLNKPIYVGMCILDLSKQHMYSFYYDILKKKYQDNVRLIYTDTDSFVIHTKTEDIYDDFNDITHLMDFSGYDVEHKCYDTTNKKKLGCFKDETDGKIITNFIALKPKSYCFRIHNEEKEEKKSKGIPKQKVKKEITYNHYNDTLEHNNCDTIKFNSIRSKAHQIYSIQQTKKSLSNYDNKRHWIDNYNSVPYGYYGIKA